MSDEDFGKFMMSKPVVTFPSALVLSVVIVGMFVLGVKERANLFEKIDYLRQKMAPALNETTGFLVVSYAVILCIGNIIMKTAPKYLGEIDVSDDKKTGFVGWMQNEGLSWIPIILSTVTIVILTVLPLDKNFKILFSGACLTGILIAALFFNTLSKLFKKKDTFTSIKEEFGNNGPMDVNVNDGQEAYKVKDTFKFLADKENIYVLTDVPVDQDGTHNTKAIQDGDIISMEGIKQKYLYFLTTDEASSSEFTLAKAEAVKKISEEYSKVSKELTGKSKDVSEFDNESKAVEVAQALGPYWPKYKIVLNNGTFTYPYNDATFDTELQQALTNLESGNKTFVNDDNTKAKVVAQALGPYWPESDINNSSGTFTYTYKDDATFDKNLKIATLKKYSEKEKDRIESNKQYTLLKNEQDTLQAKKTELQKKQDNAVAGIVDDSAIYYVLLKKNKKDPKATIKNINMYLGFNKELNKESLSSSYIAYYSLVWGSFLVYTIVTAFQTKKLPKNLWPFIIAAAVESLLVGQSLYSLDKDDVGGSKEASPTFSYAVAGFSTRIATVVAFLSSILTQVKD